MSGKKRVLLLSSSPDNTQFIFNSDDEDNIPISSVINNGSNTRSNTKKSGEKHLFDVKKSNETKSKSKAESSAPQGEESAPRKKYSFRKRDPQKIQYFTNTTWVNPSTIPDDPRLDLDILLEPVEGFDFEAKTKLKHRDQRDDDFVPPTLPLSPNSRPRKYRRLFKRSHLSPLPTTPQAKQKRTWGKDPTRLRLSTLNSEKSMSSSQAKEFDYDLPSPKLPTIEELLGLPNTSRNITRGASKEPPSVQYTIPRSPPPPSNRPLLYSPPNTFDNPSEFTFSDSELDYRLPSLALPPPKKPMAKTRSRHLNFFKFYNSQLSSLYYVPQWLKLAHRAYKIREKLGLTVSDSPWDKLIIEENGKTKESNLIRFRHHFGPRQFQSGMVLPRFKMLKVRHNRTTPDNNRANNNNSSNKGVGSGGSGIGRSRIILSNRKEVSESPTYQARSKFKIVPPKISIQTFRYKPPTSTDTNVDSSNIEKSSVSAQQGSFDSISDLNKAELFRHNANTSTIGATSITTTINPTIINQPVLQHHSLSASNLHHHNSANVRPITIENSEAINDNSSSADIIVNHIKSSDALGSSKNPNANNGDNTSNNTSPPNYSVNNNSPRESNTNAGGDDILARLGFTSNSTCTSIGSNSSNLHNLSSNRGVNSNSSALFRNTHSIQPYSNDTRSNTRIATSSSHAASSSNSKSYETGLLPTRNNSIFASAKIPAILQNQTSNLLNPIEVNYNETQQAQPEKTLIERKSWLNKFSEKLWKIHHPEQPKLPKLKRVESIIIEPTSNTLELEKSIRKRKEEDNSTFNFNEFDLEFESDNSDQTNQEEEVIIPRDDITRSEVQFEYSKPSKYSTTTTKLLEPLNISSDEEANSDNDDEDHWTNETSTQSRSRLSRSMVLRSSSSNSPLLSPTKNFDLSKGSYLNNDELTSKLIDLNNFNLDELNELGGGFNIEEENWSIEDYNSDDSLVDDFNEFEFDEEFNSIAKNNNNNDELINLMGTQYKLKIPKHIKNLLELGTSTIIQTLFKILNNSTLNQEKVKFIWEYLNLLEKHKLEGYFFDKREYLVESFDHIINNLRTFLIKIVDRSQSNRANYLSLIFDIYLKILKLLNISNNSKFSSKLNEFNNILLKFELNEILQSWEIKDLISRNKIFEKIWKKLYKLYGDDEGSDWIINNWSLSCEFIGDNYDEVSGKLRLIMEYGGGGSSNDKLPNWALIHWQNEFLLTIIERSLLPFSKTPKINGIPVIDQLLQITIGMKSTNSTLLDKLHTKFKDKVNIGDNINFYLHCQDRVEIFINQLQWAPTESFLINLFQFYKSRNYIQLSLNSVEVEKFQFIQEFENCSNFLNNRSSDYFNLLNWLKIYLKTNGKRITSRNLLIFLSKVFPTQSLKLKQNYPIENYQSFINRVALLMTLALICPSAVINLNTLLKRLKVTFVPEWQLFDTKALYIIGISYVDLIGIRLLKFWDDKLDIDNFSNLQKVFSQLHSNQLNMDNNSNSNDSNNLLLEQISISQLNPNLQVLIKLYSKLSQLVANLNNCNQSTTSGESEEDCKLLVITKFLDSIKVKNMISPLTRLPHQLRYFYLCLFKSLLEKLDNSKTSSLSLDLLSIPQCQYHNQAKNLLLNFIREDNWKNQLKFLKNHLELDLGDEEVEDLKEEEELEGKINLLKFTRVIDYFLKVLNNEDN